MIAYLSLLIMALGMAGIFWALVNINAAAHPVEAFTPSVESSTTIVASEDPVSLYSEYPEEGQEIGTLEIPALDKILPILAGTDEETLKNGIGHFSQSVLPGEKDNCVLSGHRDTVFADLGQLETGDQLVVETEAGIFTYEISNIRIVEKDDKTVIVPTDRAVLTLTTCYPFHYIGNAPKRYIVSADLATTESIQQGGF